ncbi:hypothetical protein AQZ52_16725 [Novosphingobium fuchskuhlense]|uniref:DUF4274 domain-containing protein n=1 Tax=Novosphingobium fuchskuhlense TaxID=1117702 RepID=A0A124JTR2_9SPHN|nr:DUF4274 domain-containing protein [Novosphingobium fuchskuhlense]KUR70458.1 hypothetical protein AQZ52_16725 [Novosphingobium fuchskuhlense]
MLDWASSDDEYRASLITYLKNASPDVWHRYALNHNWDDRLDGLYWIVSQPECDKATALLIFWKGCPTGYDYETEEAQMGEDVYAVAPMLRYISERFNTTGYIRSEIAYDFLEDHGLNDPAFKAINEAGRHSDLEELVERQKGVADPRVKLHPELKLLRIAGRRVAGHDDDFDFRDLFAGNVMLDAFGMFASVAGAGFGVAWATMSLSSKTGGPLVWIAAIACLAYCLRSGVANLRTMNAAVHGGYRLSSSWIVATVALAAVAGMAIGRGYFWMASGHAASAIVRYGLLAVALVAATALSYALARILISPRAIRLA